MSQKRDGQRLLDTIGAAVHAASQGGVSAVDIITVLGAESDTLLARHPQPVLGLVPSQDAVLSLIQRRLAEVVQIGADLGLPIERVRATLRWQLYQMAEVADVATPEPGGGSSWEPTARSSGAVTR